MKKPAEVFHPGEFIRESMDTQNLSIKDVAERMGTDKGFVVDLIHGNADVDEDLAFKLSFTFQTSVQYWLKLQASYDAHTKKKL